MKIKEGDKWKVAYTIPKRSFKSTVIFFGLTNLPATFQAMINKLLRDLINTGKVGSFIDNIIVGMEMKEKYNKLVTEILKRLEEIIYI